MNIPPILNYDWIQVNASIDCTLTFKYHSFYVIKLQPFSTRHFKIVEEIYRNNKRIATVTRQPLSDIIPPNTVLIKFDNWVLYSFNMFDYTKEFLSLNNLIFHNISRLDVCADFTRFANDMEPSNFIKNYLYEKYLRLGRTTAGTSYFRQQKTKINFNSLKFGSNLSDVSTYLYNKTLEMTTQKWKPWIAKKWQEAGIDKNIDVWRLEISLKSSAKALTDFETGETQHLNDINILKPEFLPTLFETFREKYFSFVVQDGQQKKSRMKKLHLFSKRFSNFTIIENQSLISANRSDKIFIKKLEQVNQELRGQNFNFNIDIDSLKSQYISICGLENWAEFKNLLSKKNQ